MVRLLDALYPRVCHLCGERLVGDEDRICNVCLSGLPRTGFHNTPFNGVEMRLAGVFPFVSATAIYYYVRDNDVSRLVYDFKYHGYPGLARRLGHLMYLEMTYTDFFDGIDGVVPVPLHWMRRLRRTYNQAEMLALGVADYARLPILDILRARFHVSQTRRGLRERRTNTKGKYYAIRREGIDGQHLLIVDDVCTTGSTLIAAAEAILAVYPHVRLSVLTLAATV